VKKREGIGSFKKLDALGVPARTKRDVSGKGGYAGAARGERGGRYLTHGYEKHAPPRKCAGWGGPPIGLKSKNLTAAERPANRSCGWGTTPPVKQAHAGGSAAKNPKSKKIAFCAGKGKRHSSGHVSDFAEKNPMRSSCTFGGEDTRNNYFSKVGE